MRVRDLAFIQWIKSVGPVDISLVRSAVARCPVSLLGLTPADLVTSLPGEFGYQPLLDAIAARYEVTPRQVMTVSGGTTFANWVACVAALDGAPRDAEVIVERPTYEPLLRLPDALGYRVRRFDRRLDEDYAIDLDRFASVVNRRTRLALVTNLHNPSGARIDLRTLRAMARVLAHVNALLLVDDVYLECLSAERPVSSIKAGPNVVTTSSLTKAYGLDGLRAGWILGPKDLIARANTLHNLVMNNRVAPGEQMMFAAFRHLDAIRAHGHTWLDPNLARLRRYFARETRFTMLMPEGGNVFFPRLPRGLDGDQFAAHLLRRYSTLVVPGRFFESPRHIRFSVGIRPSLLERGLRNLSQALDDLAPVRATSRSRTASATHGAR